MYQLSHLTIMTVILLTFILGALIFAQCIDYRDFVFNYDESFMKTKTFWQRVTQWLEFTWVRLIFITLVAIVLYGQILLLIDLVI